MIKCQEEEMTIKCLEELQMKIIKDVFHSFMKNKELSKEKLKILLSFFVKIFSFDYNDRNEPEDFI